MKSNGHIRAEAKMHATAWEHAVGELSEKAGSDPVWIERSMGVTTQQLKAQLWLANAVAAGYRRLANGIDLDD